MQTTAEDRTRSLEEVRGDAELVRLERGTVPAAAFVTEEFELKPRVVRMVGVVAGERLASHEFACPEFNRLRVTSSPTRQAGAHGALLVPEFWQSGELEEAGDRFARLRLVGDYERGAPEPRAHSADTAGGASACSCARDLIGAATAAGIGELDSVVFPITNGADVVASIPTVDAAASVSWAGEVIRGALSLGVALRSHYSGRCLPIVVEAASMDSAARRAALLELRLDGTLQS